VLCFSQVRVELLSFLAVCTNIRLKICRIPIDQRYQMLQTDLMFFFFFLNGQFSIPCLAVRKRI
jgi:hypothetical protein